MDTISREVLLQVQKDGITYKNLAKAMATIILTEEKNPSLPDKLEFILWGDESLSHGDGLQVAEEIARHTKTAVYMEEDNTKKLIPGIGIVCVCKFKRWQP